MVRAGSFVAERILGTSASPTFVNFNCANAAVQSVHLQRRTNASQQKPGRRFVPVAKLDFAQAPD